MDRFIEQFKCQKGFLERSCRLYDSGLHDEAIRIATVIRVLLHDTNASTSLAKHLGGRDKVRLLSTCPDYPYLNDLAFFDGVSVISLDGVKPGLENAGFCGFLPIDDWWNQVILISGPGIHHSRRAIILETANKDGGAHVDKEISSDHAHLRRGICSFHRGEIALHDETRQVRNHHFMCLRQFGYELLNSPELWALD
jgi:hypothetical protein